MSFDHQTGGKVAARVSSLDLPELVFDASSPREDGRRCLCCDRASKSASLLSDFHVKCVHVAHGRSIQGHLEDATAGDHIRLLVPNARWSVRVPHPSVLWDAPLLQQMVSAPVPSHPPPASGGSGSPCGVLQRSAVGEQVTLVTWAEPALPGPPHLLPSTGCLDGEEDLRKAPSGGAF